MANQRSQYLEWGGGSADMVKDDFPNDRYRLWDDLFPFDEADDDDNNLTWLWITLGVVGGVLVLGVITFIVIKKRKNSALTNYNV